MLPSLDKGLGTLDPNEVHKFGPLLPGQKHVGYCGTITDAQKGDLPAQVEAEVIAILFDDGTALGDRVNIQKLRDFRSGYAKEYERVAGQIAGFMNETHPEEDPMGSLSQLYDEVKSSGVSSGDESLAGRSGRDFAKQSALNRINRAVDSSKNEPSRSLDLLDSLAREAEHDAQILERYQVQGGNPDNK